MRSTMKRLEPRPLALAAAVLFLAAVLAIMLLRRGADDESPPPLPAPAPTPVAAAPPPPEPQPAPPSAEGLRLYGLLGAGAILGLLDGRQRFVAIGRDVTPGLRVARIEPRAVVLASTGGEIRLGFDGVAAAPEATAPASPVAAAEARQRDETIAYRFGLEPRRVGNRIGAFAVRPGVSMPALERAGLRPGDVILRVNGSQFGEEAMSELAWTIANSTRTEFEIDRAGQHLRLAIP